MKQIKVNDTTLEFMLRLLGENEYEHSKHTSIMYGRFCRILGIDKSFLVETVRAVKYHDIGKLYMKDLISLPRLLTSEEFNRIKLHTIYGYEILKDVNQTSSELALEHHENYDGTGYPYGKKAEEISLKSRILKIVDVYDALRSKRPYKKALSHRETLTIMRYGDYKIQPSHFDLELMIKFVKNNESFETLHDKFRKY